MNKIIYKVENKEVEIVIENLNAWLSTKEIATLFDKDRTTISRHLNSILKDENRTCAKMGPTSAKFAQVQLEGDRKIARNVDGFSLDVVLQIGERIKSNKGKELKTYIDNYFKQQFSNNDNNIIIYNNGSLSLPVNVSQEEETVWLNESQIAMLFETTRQNINLHINNILSDGELDAGSICKDFLHMGSTGQQYLVTFYNLDMVLAVGYRVKTKRAMEFRNWASRILSQYIRKGYAINKDRIEGVESCFISLTKEINELKEKVNKLETISEYQMINNKWFEKNTTFDAFITFVNIVQSAKRFIAIIDPYFDIKALTIFKYKYNDINIIVITSKRSNINDIEINKFNEQYGGLKVIKDDGDHDRYMIIDNVLFYSLGNSLNYAGRKRSLVYIITDKDTIEKLMNRIKPYL